MRVVPGMYIRDFHREFRFASNRPYIASVTEFLELQALIGVSNFIMDQLDFPDPWMRQDMGYSRSQLDDLMRANYEKYQGAEYPYQDAASSIVAVIKEIRTISGVATDASKDHAAIVFSKARDVVSRCFELAQVRPEYYNKIKYLLFADLCYAMLPGGADNPMFMSNDFRDTSKTFLVGFLLMTSSIIV
jgi:hypothetical protein